MEFYTHILQFECIGDRCPDNCCSGWRVPISASDQDRLSKYLSPQQLNAHLEPFEGQLCMTQHAGRCTLLTPEGLCRIHQEHGSKALPQICHSFPRTAIQHSDGQVLVGGLLSCPEVARIMLESEDGLRLTEGASQERLSVATVLTDKNAYEQAYPLVQNQVAQWLNEQRWPMAIHHIATLAGLSIAYFNRASNQGAWADCMQRLPEQLRNRVPSNTADIYAVLFAQAKIWLPKLSMYPIPQARLQKALEMHPEAVVERIMHWHVSWGDAVIAIRRYWLHYLRVYSYTESPNLGDYFFRLALSTALFKWLCAAHAVKDMAAAAEQLYCVERIIEHSPWKSKAIHPFQELKSPLKALIVGLVL